MTRDEYDVVVIGGGPAGLGGALLLARSRRSVLVVDAGDPRNVPAAHIHSFLTRDGTPPAEFLAAGRAEVRGYGGDVVDGTVVAATAVADGFDVRLADGTGVRARRLLVTTGLADELPDVPGIAQRWGRDVLHCPYCHGWEVRDQRVGILATGPAALHQAQLFRQLTDQVTVLTHTGPEPAGDDLDALTARDIAVVSGEVTSLVVAEDRLTGARLASGDVVALDAVVVAPRMVARAGLLRGLGLDVTDHPAGVGQHIAADPTGRTTVPGVWVAGNVTDVMAQVLGAAAAGSMAGAAINGDLITEEVGLAVTRRRPATL
jgi:thioredoxin reductase